MNRCVRESAASRIGVRDFAGRRITISNNPAYWKPLRRDSSASALVLGLGPDGNVSLPGQYSQVYWLDSAEMLAQTCAEPPAGWKAVECEEVGRLAGQCDIFFYEPGRSVAPEFWRKLLGRLELSCQSERPERAKRLIWLPGTEAMLLHRELACCLALRGYTELVTAMPDAGRQALLQAFGGMLPAAAISVNFRGLDAKGQIFTLLEQLKVPLAIWLVDNPWNLLSGIPLPWWQEASLFVTDASFIASLKNLGAKNVYFLPLAASPGMLKPQERAKVCSGGKLSPPLFVGRSAFPDRKKFFAGTRVRPELMQEAQSVLEAGVRPDYHWFSGKLGQNPWPPRPGSRAAAFGTEEMSRANRASWLNAAVRQGVQIVGDAGWEALLPGVKILPPVDYYGSLPDLYASAEYVLNVTSLQLPASLNQRHFDVWAAGGFLLTDRTGGLSLFPPELVKAIALDRPDEIKTRMADLSPNRKYELQRAWQAEIGQSHLYGHRLSQMLELIDAV